jgi:hypothetical protein
MASREDVIVRFGGDAKGVNATLASIRTSVSGLGSSLSSMAASFGVGLGLGAVATAVKETLGWADDLAETADRVGLTTDAIQSLRLEAELFGVTTEEVDAALTKFSINLGKARQGTGDLYAIFKQYNQSLAGTATEVLQRYIVLLQQAKSEAEQNRIAVAGFGKAGAKMAQSIAESGMPLEQMIAKFRELGLVMDEVSIRKTAELNDQFDRLAQQGGMALKQFVVDAIAELQTLGTGFERIGIMLSHWASGDFIGLQGVVDLMGAPPKKPEAKPVNPATSTGAPTDEGEKKIDDALKAREAAKDAARLKDMTASQRQWELESRILRAMNEEKEALAKKDEERARKAQETQEAALQKLIADPVTPDYVVEKYAKMVKAIESAPGPEVKMRINWEELDKLPQRLQDAIRAPGSGYVIDMTVQVHPVLSGDSYLLLESDIDRQPVGPLPSDITKEADAAGANP